MVRYRSIGERSGGKFKYVDASCINEEENQTIGLTQEGLYYYKEFEENGVTKYNVEKLLIIEGDEATKEWLERKQTDEPPVITINTPFRYDDLSNTGRIQNVLNGSAYEIDAEISYGCLEYEWEIRDNRDTANDYFSISGTVDNKYRVDGKTLQLTRDGVIEFMRDKKNDPTFILGDIKVRVTYGDKGDDNIEDVISSPIDGVLEHPISFSGITVPELLLISGEKISATVSSDFGALTAEQVLVTANETIVPNSTNISMFGILGSSLDITANKAGVLALSQIPNTTHTVRVFFGADSNYTNMTYSGANTMKLEQPITFGTPLFPEFVGDTPQFIQVDATKDHGTFTTQKIEVTDDDVSAITAGTATWSDLETGALTTTKNKSDILGVSSVAAGSHTVQVRFQAQTDFSRLQVDGPYELRLEQPITLTLTTPDFITSTNQTISATATRSHGDLTEQKLQISDTGLGNDWEDLSASSLEYTTATTTNLRAFSGIDNAANTFYFRAIADSDFTSETISDTISVNVNYPVVFSNYVAPTAYIGNSGRNTASIDATVGHGQFKIRRIEVGASATATNWDTIRTFNGEVGSPVTMTSNNLRKNNILGLTNIPNNTNTIYIRFVAKTDFSIETFSDAYAVKINQPISISTQPTAPSSDISSTPQTMSVAATSNHGTFVYRWEVTDDSSARVWGTIGTNSNTISLTTAIIRAADSVDSSATTVYIRCVVSSDFANSESNSNIITLTLT